MTSSGPKWQISYESTSPVRIVYLCPSLWAISPVYQSVLPPLGSAGTAPHTYYSGTFTPDSIMLPSMLVSLHWPHLLLELHCPLISGGEGCRRGCSPFRPCRGATPFHHNSRVAHYLPIPVLVYIPFNVEKGPCFLLKHVLQSPALKILLMKD